MAELRASRGLHGCLQLVRRVCIGALLVSAAAAAVAREQAVDLAAILPTTKATMPGRLQQGALVFQVTGSGVCMLPLSGLRSLRFDYATDGYLTVDARAVPEGAGKNWRPPPAHSFPQKLLKGSGQCSFDLRRSLEWNSGSTVALFFDGTGAITLRNMSMDALEPDADVAAERNRALFWQPEQLRHTTINLLTPIYPTAARQLSWPLILGLITVAMLTMVALASWPWRRLRRPYVLAAVAVAGLLVQQAHWLWRTAPVLNKELWLSSDDKIRRHYFLPEFGMLAAAAREQIPADAKVVIQGRKGDWFGPQTLAFNLAPRRCGFRVRKNGQEGMLNGIGDNWSPPVSTAEADYWVSYYGEKKLPAGFQKVFELNPQVFIARRHPQQDSP